MAEATNTLAGLIQLNDRNLDDLNATDILDDAPLLQVLFAKAASNGTQHKHLKQTVASSAAFRAVNAGLSKTYSQDELVTIALKVIDASFDFDKALLMGSVLIFVVLAVLMLATRNLDWYALMHVEKIKKTLPHIIINTLTTRSFVPFATIFKSKINATRNTKNIVELKMNRDKTFLSIIFTHCT